MNQTMNKTLGSALLITLLALAGCGKNAGAGGTAGEAEVATQKANEAMTQELNLADPQDFEDAKHVASLPPPRARSWPPTAPRC